MKNRFFQYFNKLRWIETKHIPEEAQFVSPPLRSGLSFISNFIWLEFSRQRNKNVLLIFFVFAVAILSHCIPFVLLEQQIPRESLTGFLNSYQPDFFQYVAIIRMGKEEGKLLFVNPYSEENFAPMVLQPLYTVSGLLSKPTNITPFQVYFALRLISLLSYVAGALLLIFAITPKFRIRALSSLFFLSATAIWSVVHDSGGMYLLDPQTFTKNFNALFRLLLLPPHHVLAISLALFLAALFIKSKKDPRIIILFFFGGLGLSLLHPYITIIFLIILSSSFVITTLVTRTISLRHLIFLGGLFSGVVPILGYDYYMYNYVWHQPSFMGGARTIELFTVIKSVGFVALPAFFSVFNKKLWKTQSFWILWMWALCPLVLYFSPKVIPISGNYRFFQISPHIAWGILAALGVDQIIKMRYIGKWLGIAITVSIVGYMLPMYPVQIPYAVSRANPEYYWHFIYTVSNGVFGFLKTTKPGSVVLAGETVSAMIPAMTKNRVIVGHNGNANNYDEKLGEIRRFYYGLIPVTQVPDFLRRYRVSYIIYGIDSSAFHETPYAKEPYLKEVYSDGGVSVVQVLHEEK